MVNIASLNPFGPSVKATSEVTQLRVYPIKSCRGISIRSTTLTRQGLDLDRRWMFIDKTKENRFQTIREMSALTLVNTEFSSPDASSTDGGENALELIISISNDPSKRVQIPARPTEEWLAENTKVEEVEIWGMRTDGYVYNDEFNEIFTDLVGKPIALVYKGPTPRLAGGNGAPKHLGRTESINFPDVMPVQIANEASMAELNSRLQMKGHDEITIERFRPNIIVRGGEADGMPAWSEDSWKTVRIVNGEPQSGSILSSGPSTLDIDVCMRCARCQVPNVNPDTAEKHPKQPWDTLVSYRRVDEGHKFKPCFGMLCAPRTEGQIGVGMKFEVTETTNNHFYIKGF